MKALEKGSSILSRAGSCEVLGCCANQRLGVQTCRQRLIQDERAPAPLPGVRPSVAAQAVELMLGCFSGFGSAGTPPTLGFSSGPPSSQTRLINRTVLSEVDTCRLG